MAEDPKPEGATPPESAPKPEPAPAETQPAAPAAAPPGEGAAEAEKAAGAPAEPQPAAAPKPAAAAAKPAAKPAAPKVPAVMAATAWESELTQELAAEFGERITAFSSYLGQSFVVCQSGAAVPILESLRDNHGFDYLVDVTAVHYPDKPAPFELIYIVYSFERNERVRIKMAIRADEKPETAVPIYITADWLEREVYDMFGIEFDGHPNMKRILMPDEWETFPLRKENSILKMDERWVQENLGIESGQ